MVRRRWLEIADMKRLVLLRWEVRSRGELGDNCNEQGLSDRFSIYGLGPSVWALPSDDNGQAIRERG